jgi:hypothetical protein
MARPCSRRGRRRVPGVLASAPLDGRHAGAVDVRIALSTAVRPCDVRQRRDGDRGGADLARSARHETRPAPADRAGLRVHGDPRRDVRDGDRGGHTVRPVPGRQQSIPRVAVAVVHDQWLPCRAATTVRAAPASHGPQRDAGVVHHHQPDLGPGVGDHMRAVAGQRLWGGVKSTSCGSWPASPRGWAGRFRFSRCSGC